MYPRDQPTPGTPSKNLVKALALAREDGAFRKPLRAVVERNSGAVCSTMPPSLQETRLAEKLTVLETLALFSSFYRRGQEPRVVLARCHRPRRRRPGQEAVGRRAHRHMGERGSRDLCHPLDQSPTSDPQPIVLSDTGTDAPENSEPCPHRINCLAPLPAGLAKGVREMGGPCRRPRRGLAARRGIGPPQG